MLDMPGMLPEGFQRRQMLVIPTTLSQHRKKGGEVYTAHCGPPYCQRPLSSFIPPSSPISMLNFAALFSLVVISGVMAAPHFKVCAFCLQSIYPITYWNFVECRICRSEIHDFFFRAFNKNQSAITTPSIRRRWTTWSTIWATPQSRSTHISSRRRRLPRKKYSATSGQTLATICTQSTTKMRNAMVGKRSQGLWVTSTKTTIAPAPCRFSAMQRRQRRLFLHD
jgi:hypothetical protein